MKSPKWFIRHEKYINMLTKKLVGINIDSWHSDTEYPGLIVWYNSKYDDGDGDWFEVWSTPFWDNQDGIPVQLTYDARETDKQYGCIPFELSFILDKDKEEFIRIMTKQFKIINKDIEKILKNREVVENTRLEPVRKIIRKEIHEILGDL